MGIKLKLPNINLKIELIFGSIWKDVGELDFIGLNLKSLYHLVFHNKENLAVEDFLQGNLRFTTL